MYASITRACASIAKSSVMLTLIAGADELADGVRALVGARHLDHHVRPIDRRPEALRLGDGRVRVVGRAGRDLDRDVAVGAVGALVDAAEDVARVAHVGRLDELEQLQRREVAGGAPRI